MYNVKGIRYQFINVRILDGYVSSACRWKASDGGTFYDCTVKGSGYGRNRESCYGEMLRIPETNAKAGLL